MKTNQELEVLINEKYDQLNKDLFDFKDTLILMQKDVKQIKEKKRKLLVITTTTIGFVFLFLWKKK